MKRKRKVASSLLAWSKALSSTTEHLTKIKTSSHVSYSIILWKVKLKMLPLWHFDFLRHMDILEVLSCVWGGSGSVLIIAVRACHGGHEGRIKRGIRAGSGCRSVVEHSRSICESSSSIQEKKIWIQWERVNECNWYGIQRLVFIVSAANKQIKTKNKIQRGRSPGKEHFSLV